MPTTACPDCGGLVSTRATACPHCGSPGPFGAREESSVASEPDTDPPIAVRSDTPPLPKAPPSRGTVQPSPISHSLPEPQRSRWADKPESSEDQCAETPQGDLLVRAPMPWSLRILTGLGVILMCVYGLAAAAAAHSAERMKEEGMLAELPESAVAIIEGASGSAVFAMLLLLPALVGAFRRDRSGYICCLATAWGFAAMKLVSWIGGWGPIMLLSYLPEHFLILWFAGGAQWRRYFEVGAHETGAIEQAPWRALAGVGLGISISVLCIFGASYAVATVERPYLVFREFGARHQPISEMQRELEEQMEQSLRRWSR